MELTQWNEDIHLINVNFTVITVAHPWPCMVVNLSGNSQPGYNYCVGTWCCDQLDAMCKEISFHSASAMQASG